MMRASILNTGQVLYVRRAHLTDGPHTLLVGGAAVYATMGISERIQKERKRGKKRQRVKEK
jgi:hypothetical protein